MAKIKNENLIHLRVGYERALESKKDILMSEVNLLEIAKRIKNYHTLRKKELDLKAKLHRKTKEIDTSIKKLQNILPKIVMPKILKKEPELEEISAPEKKALKEKIVKKKKEEKKEDDSLEAQLKAIKEKLKHFE